MAPSATPVRLVWAVMGNRGCSSCQHTYGVIEVEHVAREKEVDVFYESYPSTVWPSVKAEFFRILPNGKELWAFRDVPLSPARMAIRLRGNGSEYWWDNNGGGNYVLSVDPAVGGQQVLGAAADGVIVRQATFTMNGGRNTLSVKLVGPTLRETDRGDVGIVYSTDGWRSVLVAFAEPRTTAGAHAEWALELGLLGQEVRFAAFTRDGAGRLRWDNAYGQDFFCGQPSPWAAPGCTGGALLPREVDF